jgi:hypothetical protein
MSRSGLVQHTSGSAGGYLIGRSHANHGIKAINKSNGQHLELEGGEAVITRRALADTGLHSFDGMKLTQRQILSRINQNGGGVSFENGGEIIDQATCMCSGNIHTYDGKQMSDVEVFAEMAKGGQTSCGCNHASTKSNSYFPHKHLPGLYERGGLLPQDLTEAEKTVLRLFSANPRGYISMVGYDVADIPNLLERNIVYATGLTQSGTMDVFITDAGRSVVKRTVLKEGGTVKDGKPEKMVLKSGKPAADYQFFKGLDHQYANPFQLNKAIEEFLDKKANADFSSHELQFIKYYSGYGGLEKLGAEGVGLLYEYYTPDLIIQRMWGLAYKYGYKGGSVLEPSCGTGEFLKYLPLQVDAIGYEINKYSARISKLLYPNVNIENKYFEELFIKGRDTIRSKITGLKKYDLIIGNPPYGNFQGKYAGMGEKSYTKANNYIDYFILRGLDLLKSGGLLVYIIGAEVAAGGIPFLDQEVNPIKKEIASKAELLDAYRLPNGVFDRTDVLSDIIVLKKK